MKLVHSFSVIDTHAAGEPIRIIRGGMPFLRGATMFERMEYMRTHHDWVRTATMCEPRGHRAMVGAVLTEPTTFEADIGVFYFDLLNYAPMCGAGALAIAKSIVETGMVSPTEPVTKVVMDTPSGLVSASVSVDNNEVKDVSVENVPSFLADSDVSLTVPGLGEISVDIGYGGNFFVFVDVEPLGLEISVSHAPYLVDMGMHVLKAANETLKVQHPVNKDINLLNDMMFCQRPRDANDDHTSLVVFGSYQFDRSPCGTGTCARMARMYSKGELKINQPFIHKSVIGTTFTGLLTREEKIGGLIGVVPIISGETYITGFNNLVVDANDKLKNGFLV